MAYISELTLAIMHKLNYESVCTLALVQNISYMLDNNFWFKRLKPVDVSKDNLEKSENIIEVLIKLIDRSSINSQIEMFIAGHYSLLFTQYYYHYKEYIYIPYAIDLAIKTDSYEIFLFLTSKTEITTKHIRSSVLYNRLKFFSYFMTMEDFNIETFWRLAPDSVIYSKDIFQMLVFRGLPSQYLQLCLTTVAKTGDFGLLIYILELNLLSEHQIRAALVLVTAVKHKNYHILEFMLDKYDFSSELSMALMTVVEFGSEEEIEYLLDLNAKPNSQSAELLMHIYQRNSNTLERIKYLIKRVKIENIYMENISYDFYKILVKYR